MNFWKVSTFALSAALGASALYASVTPASAEPQPQMHAAKELLEGAKRHLENATADKGGHRARAITLTSQALEEVRKGIEFDNRR